MNEEPARRRGLEMSPFVVGILGIIAGGIMVVTFHCIMIACFGANSNRQTTDPTTRQGRGRGVRDNNREDTSSSSTSNSTVDLVAVRVDKYSSSSSSSCEETFSEEGVCAVCLGKFKEGDEVRVLPECAHVFHLTCIDQWLFSRPSCPLCRASLAPPPSRPGVPAAS